MWKQPRVHTATERSPAGIMSVDAPAPSKAVTPNNSIFSRQFSASVACQAYPLGLSTRHMLLRRLIASTIASTLKV